MASAFLYKSPGNSNEQPEEVTHRQNSEEFFYVHSLCFYKLIYDMAKITIKKKKNVIFMSVKNPVQFNKPQTSTVSLTANTGMIKQAKAQEMAPRSGWRNTKVGWGLVSNKHHFE